MDQERFDRLTRTLASGQTRRGVLKGLGGGLMAGMFAALGRSDALADVCKADGKACKKDDQCCSGECIGGSGTGSTGKSSGVCGCTATPNGGFCDAHSDCCSGICQGGTCVATVAGTCTGSGGECGNGLCDCFKADRVAICGRYLCDDDDTQSCPSESEGEVMFASSIDACGGGSGCFIPCPPFVCFTGETRVAMADGTSRPIERVAVGDLVLGQGGINRVVDIERPTLGAKPLYALNDGPFFVTADHPFLTETGWKAINPRLTVGIPNLVIGRLAVGDRLLALAGVPVLAGGGSTLEAVIPELVGVAVERIGETTATRRPRSTTCGSTVTTPISPTRWWSTTGRSAMAGVPVPTRH